MAEDYTTKKDSVEHKTPKIKLTFIPRLNDGDWKRTGDDFLGAENWFEKVPGDTTVIATGGEGKND